MQKSKIKNQNGFSLLETLVAVAILMGAVLGPLSLASQSIRSSGLSAERITAFFLAQEAVEFVRNLRDTNGLARFDDPGREWLDGLEDCLNADGCVINPFPMDSGGLVALCSGTCPELPYGTDFSGIERYGYDIPEVAEVSRKYTRTVKITPVAGQEDREAEVGVTVSWETRFTQSGSDSFVVNERLFNWIAP